MADEREGPDTLRVPFIFVRHGDPEPLEWMAQHPDWVKIPTVMIPRRSRHHPANGGPYPRFDTPPVKPAAPAEPDEAEWPAGKPMAAPLRGAMSRLRPGGQPPQYPGGLGAPPGTPGTGDPVAAFLRADAALQTRVSHPAGNQPAIRIEDATFGHGNRHVSDPIAAEKEILGN